MQAQSEPFVGPKRSKRNAPLISPIGDFGRQLAGFPFRHDHDNMGGILMHHHRVFGPGERGIFLPVDAQEPVIVTASNAD